MMNVRIKAAAVLAVTSALAAAALPAAAQDWSGSYWGTQFGLGQGEGGGFSTFAPIVFVLNEPKGLTLGAHVGMQRQFAGKWVVGGEFEVMLADQKGRGPVSTAPAQSIGTKIDGSAALRLRVGYDAGAYMPYFAAGLAAGNIETSPSVTPGVIVGTSSDWMAGWTAALGVDYALSPKTVLRAEIRHSDYGAINYPAGTFPGIVDLTTYDITMTELRFGMSFKF